MKNGHTVVILLSVAVAAVSLVIGFTTAASPNPGSDLNRLTGHILVLARDAQTYYSTPLAEGGGGGSFRGIEAGAAGLRTLGWSALEEAGAFTVLTAGDEETVTIQGVGHTDEDGDGRVVTVRVEVRSDGLQTTILGR